MKTWSLQDAKAKLSELVSNAVKEPQMISRRGVNECIVMSVDQYKKLTEKKETLVSFLRNSPLYGVEITFDRNVTPSREVKF